MRSINIIILPIIILIFPNSFASTDSLDKAQKDPSLVETRQNLRDAAVEHEEFTRIAEDLRAPDIKQQLFKIDEILPKIHQFCTLTNNIIDYISDIQQVICDEYISIMHQLLLQVESLRDAINTLVTKLNFIMESKNDTLCLDDDIAQIEAQLHQLQPILSMLHAVSNEFVD